MTKTETKETKVRKIATPAEATKILADKRDDAKRPIPAGTTYTVTKFEGQSKPATVKCNKHGEWVNTFSNLIGLHSSLCPTCSKEIRSAAAAVRKEEREKVAAVERQAKEQVRAAAKAVKDAEKKEAAEAKAKVAAEKKEKAAADKKAKETAAAKAKAAAKK